MDATKAALCSQACPSNTNIAAECYRKPDSPRARRDVKEPREGEGEGGVRGAGERSLVGTTFTWDEARPTQSGRMWGPTARERELRRGCLPARGTSTVITNANKSAVHVLTILIV